MAPWLLSLKREPPCDEEPSALTNPSTSCLSVVSKEPSACKTNNHCDTMHPHEHILSTFKHIIDILTFDIRRRLSISCLGWCQSKNGATAVPNESAKTQTLLIDNLTPHIIWTQSTHSSLFNPVKREISSNTMCLVAGVRDLSLLAGQQLLTLCSICVLWPRPGGLVHGPALSFASQWATGRKVPIKINGPVQVIQHCNTGAHLTRSG